MNRRIARVRSLQLGELAEFRASPENVDAWTRELYGSSAAQDPAGAAAVRERLADATSLPDAWWSLVYGAAEEGHPRRMPSFPTGSTLVPGTDWRWRDLPTRPDASLPAAYNEYLSEAARLGIAITPAVLLEAQRAGNGTRHRPVATFKPGAEASGLETLWASRRSQSAAQAAAHAAAAEERRRALEAAGFRLQDGATAPVMPTLTPSQQADLIAKGYIAPAPTPTATVTAATGKSAEAVLPTTATASTTVTAVEPAGPNAETRAWEWRQVVAAAKTLPTPAKIGAGLAVAGLLYALFRPSTETAHAPRYR